MNKITKVDRAMNAARAASEQCDTLFRRAIAYARVCAERTIPLESTPSRRTLARQELDAIEAKGQDLIMQALAFARAVAKDNAAQKALLGAGSHIDRAQTT